MELQLEIISYTLIFKKIFCESYLHCESFTRRLHLMLQVHDNKFIIVVSIKCRTVLHGIFFTTFYRHKEPNSLADWRCNKSWLLGLFAIVLCNTRSSAAADGPRDAQCQSKSCQLLHNCRNKLYNKFRTNRSTAVKAVDRRVMCVQQRRVDRS